MLLPFFAAKTLGNFYVVLDYLFRRRQWHPTPVLLPGKSHGQRSLVGCSPRGRWGLDMTERLHFHFSLSCIGKGNGNPLQCSCLENPRNGGASWAAVYGVAQSRIRLKRLSSSSTVSQTQRHLPSFTHLKERALGLIHPRNTSTHSEKGLMYTDAMSYS